VRGSRQRRAAITTIQAPTSQNAQREAPSDTAKNPTSRASAPQGLGRHQNGVVNKPTVKSAKSGGSHTKHRAEFLQTPSLHNGTSGDGKKTLARNRRSCMRFFAQEEYSF